MIFENGGHYNLPAYSKHLGDELSLNVEFHQLQVETDLILS